MAPKLQMYMSGVMRSITAWHNGRFLYILCIDCHRFLPFLVLNILLTKPFILFIII